ncbi:hypothetical protein I305_01979 [Cryptococcus gattii E566]|uniref:Mid2 domain-containing protein n=1 Tax=Cryptococcus gattii serotype B (strain WM276 / ATCC MYA-4071) TaxID=367775 RepID=E6R4E5_CRYGW|nr:uncharacterized protein CGB_D6430W [Cryptococcus gattii WM276]ADV21938.1 hypothetical protein CND03720 [Cryptococcus gattii WM276]KIY35728.1 hypothetical protein I305_01979 [Cryptococcus gattii E566]KJE03397.1 hypothetical protein I311_02959 [Cryptococcus gattii NT-10]
MHLSALSPLLLLALAHAHASPQPAAPAHPRRHHARALAVADANRPLLPRAGAPIDNGTLASISAAEAAASSTAAASATAILSSVSSSASAASSDTLASSAVSSTASSETSSSTLATTTVQSSSTAAVSSSTVSSEEMVPSTTSSDTESSTSISSTEVIPSTSTTTSSSAVSSTSTAQPTSLLTSSPSSSSITSTAAHSTVVLVTTASRSATHSSTASATSEADNASSKSSGLSKPALIAIIVVASVVGLAAIGWTAFRKWKLRPSNRFDSKMMPIDFSPQNGNMDDDFFEKTLQRTTSQSSANRQRQELVAQLDDDPNHVAGVPEHDFTASAGVGAYGYQHDQYAGEQYEYDQYGGGYDNTYEHAYPPLPSHAMQHGYEYGQDDVLQQPATAVTTDSEGYAELQRGPSIGSGSGHGHGQAPLMSDTGVYPGELQFPVADTYGLGRPSHVADGPYAQAANFRY